MNRRDALKTIGGILGSATIARLLPGCASGPNTSIVVSELAQGYPSNFQLLSQNTSWSATWTSIVTGRFTSSVYSDLLFYDAAAGLATISSTDGNGHLINAQTTPVPTGAGIVVPGRFDNSGFDGVLFYNPSNGNATFYSSNGSGGLRLLNQTSWSPGWATIVPGFFTVSGHTSLLFYAPRSDAWLYDTDGAGNIDFVQSFDVGLWTHVFAGEFNWNPGTNFVSVCSHLFFYDSVNGIGQPYYKDPTGLFAAIGGPQTGLPIATHAVCGNFGANDRPSLFLYDRSTGTANVLGYSVAQSDDAPPPEWVWSTAISETLNIANGLPSTVDILVGGVFWMSDPEDHWFRDGVPETLSWQVSPGLFTSLLFYTRATTSGVFFAHEPPGPTSRPTIEGYITCTTESSVGIVSTGSVLPGETIDICLSSSASCQISFLRPGIDSAPLAQVSGTFSPGVMSVARLAYRDGANWPTTYAFSIPTGWSSGLYVARIQSGGTTLDLPFVVRSPVPGTQGRVLLVVADTNYEAYNTWAGRCVYGYGYGGTDPFWAAYPQTQFRFPYAFRLSFGRPYSGWTAETVSPSSKWEYWEVPMIKWLVQEGVDFEVCTSRDLEFNPPSVAASRLLVFPGHHEYWSDGMRAGVEEFTDAGGNVAFLCGNTSWWRVRFENNGATLVCYKEQSFDPNTSDPTINWYALSDPEWSMTGLSYYINSTGAALQTDPVGLFYTGGGTVPSHWALANTGMGADTPFGSYLAPGAQEGQVNSVIGTECDQTMPTSPSSLIVLATARYEGDTVGTMAVFTRGGGTVFNAATMNWVLGLSPNVMDGPTTMDIITENVVTKLSVQPFHVGRSAAADNLGQLTLVARCTDNSIRYTRENGAGGGWGAWSTLGGNMRSRPVVAANPDGHLEIFVLDANSQIQHLWGSVDASSWSAWNSLGGPSVGLVSQPFVAHNLDGRLEVFARGGDNAIWHAWQTAINGTWSGWYSMSGSVSGVPAVCVQIDGRMTVFARGLDGTLQRCVQAAVNGPWGAWASLGGALESDPGVGRNLDGHLEVFASQQNGQLAHIWQSPSGTWSAWTSTGATSIGTPSIGLNFDGRLEVFAVGTDGVCGHLWQEAPNGDWSAWQSFGISTNSTTLDVGLNQDGRMEFFVANTSDVMYHMWQTAQNGSWAGPQALAGIAVVP